MTPDKTKAKIHVERMMHRSSIAIAGESAASYALLKLIPATGGSGATMSLNLAMVLDVSGSMYEEDGTGKSRLSRVQEAAIGALEYLRPEDKITIVAFAHNAELVLPATAISQKNQIIDTIMRIDMFHVDAGGTSMDQGIDLGLNELHRIFDPKRISQLIVLTDGETSGEQLCRQHAKRAADTKINLSVIGVGTEWNSGLIKDLAALSNGKWHYIDVNQIDSAQKVFASEFQSLSSVGFQDVEIHLMLMKDIKVRRVRMVVPEIKDLNLQDLGERHFSAKLGPLEKDKTSRYILDLSLPKRPDGKFKLLDIEVTFDAGAANRESSGAIPLEMNYTAAGHGYINAEVARHIDEVQIFELNKNLQEAISQGNTQEATRVAQSIEKKGEVMGSRASKKTMLAKQVLAEINQGGRVSKKTQLAVDDAARAATE
ncbi:MAG: VWA domain-containing protein [Gemmataceae bacterium]|nr:VWA domain-containing protein [Gemmataceae bacterium]